MRGDKEICGASAPALMTRRGLIGAGTAAAIFSQARAAAPAAQISGVAPSYTPEELVEIFGDMGEPPAPGVIAKKFADVIAWGEQSPLEMAVWPTDESSIDYAHIGESKSDDAFALTDRALTRLLDWNSFLRLHAQNSDRLLFGLRGAEIVEPDQPLTGFRAAIQMREATPDHFDYRCVLGVWDRAAKMIYATRASTVPHVGYLYAQREEGTASNEANMMPTGLYRYRVGTHRNGTKNRQPGAFRPDYKVGRFGFSVLRCFDAAKGEITLSVDKFWDVRRTHHHDNIHAGTYGGKLNFWSAGCQTIPGYYNPKGEVPMEEWARFRIAAGLLRTPELTTTIDDKGDAYTTSSEDGRIYNYLLLTGREARLAATKPPAFALRRLRFGSAGEAVRRLEKRLGLPGTDALPVFGQTVQRRLLELELSRTLIVDGGFGT